MRSITLRAYAKVNLVLKVLKKRRDGYHDIRSLFERISLADTITISRIPSGITIISDVPITDNPADNIMYKAAQLMISRFRLTVGVRIRIRKRIPIAAGLGGGSADAAAILLGMTRLFMLPIDGKGLMHFARRLGADVPFFLLETPFAVGTGRGDRLVPVDPGIRLWHLIVNPGTKLSTKAVYEAFDRLGREKRVKSGDFGLTRRRGDVTIQLPYGRTRFDSLEALLDNDLERVAKAKDRVVQHTVERLASSTGRKTILSGSGPSVFCLFKTQKEARQGMARLVRCLKPGERKRWRIMVAKTEG